MKKIICLILALACSFALFSCGDEEGPAPEDKLIEIAGSSEPTQIITRTYYTEKSTSILYEGVYTTVFTDGGFTLEYSYQEKAPISLDSDAGAGSVATKTGKVEYKDGKYSTDGGETWVSEAPDTVTLGVVFNVTKANLGTYTVSDDGKTLEAVLTAENVANLLGITIPAETADAVITTNGTYLTGMTIEYSSEQADVVIATSYSYIGTGAPAEEAPAE